MKSAALPSDPAAESAYSAVRGICRRSAKDFYFAATFLPKAKRRAAYAVVAFCGMARDALAQAGDAMDAAPPSTVAGSCCTTSSFDQTLAMFRDRLDDIYEQRLELPLPEFRDESQHALSAFGQAVRRYQIPRQLFLDLAEGYRMDHSTRRYATWASVEKFYYHSAGVLARIMSCVFGLTHSDAYRQAIQLGNAMQLMRVLRDLPADWKR